MEKLSFLAAEKLLILFQIRARTEHCNIRSLPPRSVAPVNGLALFTRNGSCAMLASSNAFLAATVVVRLRTRIVNDRCIVDMMSSDGVPELQTL